MFVRSYSRHSRVIWCEATAETSGQSSRTPREHRLLVRRVGVGVEQADRDRLDALGAEAVDDLRQPVQVERLPLDVRRASCGPAPRAAGSAARTARGFR